MTETESEDWRPAYRMHYLTISIVALGQAAIMLDLQLAGPFWIIGGMGMVAYIADLSAELYHEYR